MIISASLIRPFLLRCFGLSVEGYEREREVLFNSKLYSLQKSSAIQWVSVTLLTSFMRIVILLYDWLSTVDIQKTILFLGFYWNFFEEKEVLLIPNWGIIIEASFGFLIAFENTIRMSADSLIASAHRLIVVKLYYKECELLWIGTLSYVFFCW